MLSRIFPKAFDNSYRGHWLGIWLFGLVVVVKLGQGANSLINPHLVMSSADGIPVDSFTGAAAATAIALFALLGLYALILPLLGVLVLIRYRTMIPLMFVLFLIVQAASFVLRFAHPIARSADYNAVPIGLYINIAFVAVMLIELVLSVIGAGARMPSLTEGARP